MLQTGRTVLIEEGLGIRADTLSFKRVFERVEADTGIRLSNASIIRRVWANQADYQADVLASIAAQEGLGEFDKTIQALAPVIEGLDLSTPEARGPIAAGGVPYRWRGPTSSCSWSHRTGRCGLRCGRWPPPTPAPGARRGTSTGTGSRPLCSTATTASPGSGRRPIGLWPRSSGCGCGPPLTFRQLSVAVGALAEGCSLRQRVDGAMAGILRPTGPGGAEQEWTLFAIGLEALVEMFLEPDPDWAPGPGAA